MSDDKITVVELREMFGNELPMDAVHLLERKDLTTDQVREQLRELAAKTKLPTGQLPHEPQYTNIFTIDGQPFQDQPMHPPVELGLAIQKLSILNSNSQITAMWGLAETIDENGNHHFAIIKYGRGADDTAFASRLADLYDEYHDAGDQ